MNAIDRFIAALWSRNDQLCVYNPQLKTMYDTHSWARDIISSNEAGQLKALTDYKLDLFISLEHNDILPTTYSTNDSGQDFMLAYLGRDIRNIVKWLRKSQRGFESDRNIHKTYNSVQTYMEGPPPVPLGSRGMEGQDGLGFKKAAFYQMVQEDFTIGRYGTNKVEAIFGTDPGDDYQFAFSNYFWFMYGILPRNGIKFKTLERGLTRQDGLTDLEIRHTIQFLALVFNIHSESVTIDGDDGIKDLRLIDVNKDDVYLPVTRSKFEIKGTYLQQTNESRQDRPQTNAPTTGTTTNPPGAPKVDLNTDLEVKRLFDAWNTLETQFNTLKTAEKSANPMINIGEEMNKVGTKLYDVNQKKNAARKAYQDKKKEVEAKKKSPK